MKWLILLCLTGCAAPTAPRCNSVQGPLINAAGDSVTLITVTFCRG